MVVVTTVLTTALVYCYLTASGYFLVLHMPRQTEDPIRIHIIKTDLLPHDNHTFPEYSYVMALQYSGQQGTGIQALMSLQCFIGSFNLSMYILEPVMTDTSYGSLLDLSSNHTSTSLLKFSDISQFNLFLGVWDLHS